MAPARGVALLRDLRPELDIKDERALAEALTRALALARAAWPDLAIDDESFLAHLARHLPATGDPAASVSALHAADLYLAHACVLGIEGAVAALQRTLLGN